MALFFFDRKRSLELKIILKPLLFKLSLLFLSRLVPVFSLLDVLEGSALGTYQHVALDAGPLRLALKGYSGSGGPLVIALLLFLPLLLLQFCDALFKVILNVLGPFLQELVPLLVGLLDIPRKLFLVELPR